MRNWWTSAAPQERVIVLIWAVSAGMLLAMVTGIATALTYGFMVSFPEFGDPAVSAARFVLIGTSALSVVITVGGAVLAGSYVAEQMTKAQTRG